MPTLNLNLPLLNAAGAPFQSSTLADALIEILSLQTKGDTFKLRQWRDDLKTDKKMIIEEGDAELLKTMIVSEETAVFQYIRWQLLDQLTIKN